MRIGYIVEGGHDKALIRGLSLRWCPNTTLEIGRFRGRSGESLRRELSKTLKDLIGDKGCDYVVVLRDSHRYNPNDGWRDILNDEESRVPTEYRHAVIYGIAHGNVDCWLAADRNELAKKLDCQPGDVPIDGQQIAHFVKSRFDAHPDSQERIRDYVARTMLNTWIENSDSFSHFYERVRDCAQRSRCQMPDEKQRRPRSNDNGFRES